MAAQSIKPNWMPGMTLEQIELATIHAALVHHDWNRTRAAEELGISIRTMRNKIAGMRKLGIAVKLPVYGGYRRRRDG